LKRWRPISRTTSSRGVLARDPSGFHQDFEPSRAVLLVSGRAAALQIACGQDADELRASSITGRPPMWLSSITPMASAPGVSRPTGTMFRVVTSAAFRPLEDGAARRRNSVYQRRIGPQST
jgi:hypothetical protein